MPSLDETSPALLAHLRVLMDEYGPRGVYDACAQLLNAMTTGPDTYGITKGLGPNAAEQLKALLPETTFADVVAAAQDPAPVHTTGTPLIDLDEMHAQRDVVAASQDPAPEPYTGPGASLGLAADESPEDFDAWRQQRGEAAGDPQNVGPMGNR